MILSWFSYLDRENVTWKDCWLVKKDIKSCFPQFSFSPKSSLLLAIRLDDEHIFISCFGWTGSPMVWGVIGSALSRRCNESLSCPVDLYCDDFMVLGVHHHASEASLFIEKFLKEVFHEKIVAEEKSVFSQVAVILGWVILTGSRVGRNIYSMGSLMFLLLLPPSYFVIYLLCRPFKVLCTFVTLHSTSLLLTQKSYTSHFC
jgi:hypothetical protein